MFLHLKLNVHFVTNILNVSYDVYKSIVMRKTTKSFDNLCTEFGKPVITYMYGVDSCEDILR